MSCAAGGQPTELDYAHLDSVPCGADEQSANNKTQKGIRMTKMNSAEIGESKGGGGRGQGNGGGWPSTTGNPSGGGRSNAPAGGK